MRVAVCFKIVPDYEDVHTTEWRDGEQLDFTYVKKIYGCFDESALETGLRLSDSLKAAGVSVETVAVTCGAPEGSVSEGLLRALFAAGFDDVVLLPACESFAPRSTAKTLATYFASNRADMIVTGRMVGPGDSGMVPVYLAHELGMEFYPEMTAAAWDGGLREDGTSGQSGSVGRIVITCKDGDFLKQYAVRSGAVCAVGDGEAGYLRLFPLKARMEAKKRVFSRFQSETCEKPECRGAAGGSGWNQTPVSGVILRSEEIENQCNFMEYKSAEETAKVLIGILNGEAEA